MTLLTPPGPKGRWLQGNLPEFRQGRLEFLEQMRSEFGTMVSYRLGPIRFVLVCDPDVLKQVLITRNKEFGRSVSTRMLKDFFGEGLLISEGKRWLTDRRLIQPTFARDQILSFGECMVQQTEDYLADWDDGQSRDVLLDMQALTMSIAAETLLGVKLADEVKAIHDPHDLIRESFDRRVESMLRTPRWIPTRFNRRVDTAYRTIITIVDELIARRKAAGAFGPDILSRLMVAQQSDPTAITDVNRRNQVLTFLFAGHETTASMLAWVWYLLSQRSEIEQRLHDEVDTVLAGRLPTVSDVPSLTFTDKIIRETLRLYPSAYVMGRRALADMELGGYRIRKGTNLVISPWLMHRDERFHEDPLSFNPDRWTDDAEQQMNQFAWFPFGAGPRVCIGNTFATMEAVLLVASIASRYRLQLVPGQEIVPHASVTIRPSPGVPVICQRRSTLANGITTGSLQATR